MKGNNTGRETGFGIFLAILVGLIGYGSSTLLNSSLADPLVIALLLGILLRTFTGENEKLKSGFLFAPRIFIPFGIIFYAAHNLNFAKFTEIKISLLIILIAVMFVYFLVIFIIGKILGQNKKITYLTATGSAICGASAIAITSSAVEAEPEDIAISLLSVTLAALFGFSVILPFLATLFDITAKTYSMLAGSVLQFTGLVKVAVKNSPFLEQGIPVQSMLDLAISVKSIRFLGLLIAIPLFGSFVKKRFHLPAPLWLFLGFGLLGTWIYVNQTVFYEDTLLQVIKPLHNVSWSIAMAAIGLNADAKQLFSNNGTKSLIMAFAGSLAATFTFFIGIYISQLF